MSEEFLGFIKVKQMDAEMIANALMRTLKSLEMDRNNLVGQGYGGASVMSSSRNGVQAKVAVQYPYVVYLHCRSHVLNLAIASGCKCVPSVRNLFDNVSKLTRFWGEPGLKGIKFFYLTAANESSKSEELSLLVDIGGIEIDEAEKALQKRSRRSTVPKFRPACWSARVTTLSAFMARYLTVLEALETISKASTGDAPSDANGHV